MRAALLFLVLPSQGIFHGRNVVFVDQVALGVINIIHQKFCWQILAAFPGKLFPGCVIRLATKTIGETLGKICCVHI